MSLRLSPRLLRAALPAISLALVLIAIGWLNPRAISYLGFNLMLSLAIPLALVTLGQMFVIAVNDLDLSIGFFVSFIGCVAATWLQQSPLLGIVVILTAVAVYALVGAIIHLRDLPAIVVTLGMSFVWQGLAILLLPQPGGRGERAVAGAGEDGQRMPQGWIAHCPHRGGAPRQPAGILQRSSGTEVAWATGWTWLRSARSWVIGGSRVDLNATLSHWQRWRRP